MRREKYLLEFNTINVAINYSYIAGCYKYLDFFFLIYKVGPGWLVWLSGLSTSLRPKGSQV